MPKEKRKERKILGINSNKISGKKKVRKAEEQNKKIKKKEKIITFPNYSMKLSIKVSLV